MYLLHYLRLIPTVVTYAPAELLAAGEPDWLTGMQATTTLPSSDAACKLWPQELDVAIPGGVKPANVVRKGYGYG